MGSYRLEQRNVYGNLRDHILKRQIRNMLIIKVKSNETIDRALRRYKKKVKQTKLHQEYRGSKTFVKPSERRRLTVAKAKYQQKLMDFYSS